MAQLHERKEQTYLTTVSLVILAFVAVAVALVYTRAVMIPFVLALFIVAMVSPIEDFLVKLLRLPRIIAIVVTLLAVIAIIAVVFLLIAHAATTIVATGWQYSEGFAYMANKALEPIEYLYHQEPEPVAPPAAPNDAGALPSASPPPNDVDSGPQTLVLIPRVAGDGALATVEVRPFTEEPPADANATSDPNDIIPPGGLKGRELRIDTKQIVMDMRNYIFNIVTNAFGTILGLISSTFFVLIFVIFLLLGRDPYGQHSRVYNEVVQKVRRYVGIKLVISSLTGLLVWTTLSFLGLELAGVFGILAFLLNFIPSIGSIIATLLPLPIAAVQFHTTPWLIVVVVAVPGAIQNLLGNFIEPKLQGEGLNLHPVTVILALSFWGLLWGIVGMFLAAPITAAVRVFLIQFSTLKPIGDLLAGELPRERHHQEAPSAPRRSRRGDAKQPNLTGE